MSERFDDIIKKQLQGLESSVPKDLFDKIRNHPDVSNAMFDAGIHSAVQSLENPVADAAFENMSNVADLPNISFDTAIQQKLTALEIAVPADMWERMVERRRRRRPAAWWWVAAGLFFVLAGGAWFSIKQSGTRIIAGNGEVSSNKPVTENKDSLPDETTSKQKNNNNQIPTDHSLQIAPQSPKETSVSKDGYKANSSSQAAFDNVNSKNNREEKLKSKVAISDFESKERFSKGNLSAAKTNSVNNLLTQKGAVSGLENDEVNSDISNAGDITSEFNTVRLAIMQQLRSAARLSPAQLLEARPRSPVIPCPVNVNDGRNDWYADVYTSAFMFNKTITDKEAGKNAKNGLDSTLHRQVSYNAGINLVKNIGQNLLIKTGLQYNSLNESFRLTRINERKLVTTVSVRIVIIAPGDTVYIRDTSVTETIGTIQRRHQNTYKQWDVPVIIGYEFGGENIRLNANAGVIANIRSSYSGEMLDDSMINVIDAKNYKGQPVYKTNVGFSLYAGLSILKPLSERTSLLIEPYARIGLGNTTTNSAWFKQKNSAAGISVGLRYQLNGSRQRR